jgi:hypothetical protein
MRVTIAVLLLVHGLVHAAIYATPKDPTKPAPFDPARSWALAGQAAAAPMRRASALIGLAVAAGYTAAGSMLLIDQEGWTAAAVAAASAALVLKVLWFNPWLTLGVALDLAVLAAAAGWPTSL